MSEQSAYRLDALKLSEPTSTAGALQNRVLQSAAAAVAAAAAANSLMHCYPTCTAAAVVQQCQQPAAITGGTQDPPNHNGCRIEEREASLMLVCLPHCVAQWLAVRIPDALIGDNCSLVG